MKTLIINSHLQTQNLYVQRDIVRANIARCKEYKSNPQYVNYPYDYKRECQKKMDAQVILIVKLDKAIAKSEQMSFPFGGYLSSY